MTTNDAQSEWATLSRLKHPYIVKYADYKLEPGKAKLYMEYCSYGDLQKYINQHKR